MKIIPAIDIMKGKVVRLVKGDKKHVLDYSSLGDPVTIASMWVSQGADILHVVDLDGASGVGDNIKVVKSILENVNVRIQFGGGIRNTEKARLILDEGVHRIILGSLALKTPYVIKQLIDEYGDERIIVALDYDINGKLFYNGWTKIANIDLNKAILHFKELGCKYFLLTSISRDGTLHGPDLDTLSRYVKTGKIIAAGGIRNIYDLLNLKTLGVYGAVIGRALYDGKIKLNYAIKMMSNDSY